MTASFLGILLLAAASFGQNPLPSGNLYGTALDEQGKTLPGVTVTLTGPGAAQTAITDTKGDFHFLNLSPAAYSATLQLEGFDTARRDVTVLLGKNAVLSVTMPVAGAAEAVTVSAEGSALDSRKTETGANFSQKELQTIPTTRDPWAILRQVPGVLLADVNVGGSAHVEQDGFVGKGSHSDQNTYNLDGVGITEIWGTMAVNFDFDSIDNVEVATGGSEPTLTTPGVTINLVTKRGTNRLLGSARVLYTGGAGWDYGVEAGGPVWKDRLWLWGAGARNAFLGQTFVTSTGEPVQSKESVDHWNAKLNAQIAPANSLVLSYVKTGVLGLGAGAGPSRSQASTWDVEEKSAAYRVEDSQVLSPKLFASLYYSYLSAGNSATPQGGIDNQADIIHDVVENSYLVLSERRPQRQAGLTASGFFDTGDLRHELKFGFGYKRLSMDSMTSFPGDGLFGSEFSEPIPPFALITRPAHVRSEANYYNTYLGDTIQAGNLTVNVGARFDYQQEKNLPSDVTANPVFSRLLPAIQYSGDSGYPITWRQFQPRIAVTYALGGNRQTLLRASYSRFTNRLNNEIRSTSAFPGPAYLGYGWKDVNENQRVEPGEVDFSDYFGAFNFDPTNPSSTVSVNQISADLRPPTTDEFIVGAEHEILSDISASFAYTRRSVRNLEFQPLIGTNRSSYEYIGNATGTAVDNGTGFVLNFSEPYYGLTECPAACVGRVLENRPDFRETYSGVELQLVKRLSHGWMLRAGFAYNDWRQHVGPGAIVDPNNMAGGSNASGLVVEGNINSKWQLNVSGMVRLPLGIETSANFYGRQGFPVLYFVSVFTNNSNNPLPNIQIGEVGAYRLPSVFVLDLHIERLFRIGSTVTVIPVLDCLNAANSHIVLQRDGSVGFYDAASAPAFGQNPNFNAPYELVSNRVFRGGVRIAF